MNHTENTASVVKEVCLLVRFLAMDVLMLHAYALRECLQSRCLAMGIHITIPTEGPSLVGEVTANFCG
jgi:hypothetical protein